jgi:UDP-2,3-diacylglucosamine pyrophosphatase LpxH
VAVFAHNLLVLSDLHLGSDLVHHAQPEAPLRARASQNRTRDLTAMLDHYRERRQGGVPWRLVIAGDFVDFAGMSVLPPIELATRPTDEELKHGLGGAEDHTLVKLDLLMDHEVSVMTSLARFLEAGNSLVIVRGNHDVDWHWEAAQEHFLTRLAQHGKFSRAQVEFQPWFYYEEGVVFIEHGHQYDAYCSFDHLLHPVSPFDPRRTVRSLSDILLRYVVRPTRGMTEAGHAAASALDYLRFALGLGVRGMLKLAERFILATRALFSLWREHLSDAAGWVKSEHERKMNALSKRHRIRIERLRALLRLQRPPITRSLPAIFASVMLDRILLVLLGIVTLVSVLILAPSPVWASGLAAAALLALVVVGKAWRDLRGSLEPSALLRERSGNVARLFPAAFIVMGHTHLPETRVTDEHSTYVNLGTWAEDDVADGKTPGLPATRTHLVVVSQNGKPVAELLTWQASGPEPFARRAEAEAAPEKGFV